MAPIRPFVAIGDIHGHARKLAALIDQLKATVPDFHKVLVVFLGDYVDRGPDVKTTIDLLLEFAEARRETGETVFLCGNHDFALMAFLGLLPSPFDATQTLRDFSGGLDTLWPPPGADAAAVAAGAAMHLQGRRYAPPHGSIFQAEATFKSYGATYGDREALGQNMPLEHKNFFANLQFIYADHSEYIFVHGGLEQMKGNSWEGIPVTEQIDILRRRDCSRGWNEPLSNRGWSGTKQEGLDKTTVVGHVPVREIDTDLPWRIAIDTCGGYSYRPLSALYVDEENKRHVIQAD